MKWIPIEEALPDKGKPVLIYYYPRHPVMEGRTYTVTRRGDVNNYTDSNGFPNTSSVTHWAYITNPVK